MNRHERRKFLKKNRGNAPGYARALPSFPTYVRKTCPSQNEQLTPLGLGARTYVRTMRPDACLLTWGELRSKHPDKVGDFCDLLAECGLSEGDVAVYEHAGQVSLMFPPQFSFTA